MIEMTKLEKEVMEQLLSNTDEPSRTLRKQYESASIEKRYLTGTGFFTYFSVPEDAPRLGKEISAKFGDVIAEIQGLRFGAGFVLHVKSGAIESLEGYSYEESWPGDVSDFTLSRDGGLTERQEKVFQNIRKRTS